MNLKTYLKDIKTRSWNVTRKANKPITIKQLDEFYRENWRGPTPTAKYLCLNSRPKFFFRPNDRAEYAAIIDERFPDSKQPIVQRANAVLQNKFEILNCEYKFENGHIEWCQDLRSGIKWPNLPSSTINIHDQDGLSDILIPWHLSRLQFLADLGRAYWLTSDIKYVQNFKALISNWDSANPYGTGINWISGKEIAIRTINLIWGLYLILGSGEIDNAFINKTIRLLYYHGLHIQNQLDSTASENDFNTRNACYLALLYLGILLPEYDRSETWRNLAFNGLESEINSSISPEGMIRESSTSNHRFALEIYLSGYQLASRNNIKFSESFKNRLFKAAQFSEAVTPSSGNAPLIGDNSNDFILKLSNHNPADHRPLVDIAYFIFKHDKPKNIPITEDRLWYLGPENLTENFTQEPPKSILYAESGLAIIRDSKFHLAFKAGETTQPRNLESGHNDILSLTLEIDGTPLIIDAGTHCYSSDPKITNRIRSATYHNTATIDDNEIDLMGRNVVSNFNDKALPHIDLWANLKNQAVVSASFSGYGRYDNKIRHKRTLLASIEDNSVLILDEFTGNDSSNHNYKLRFLMPFESAFKQNDTTVRINRNNAQYFVLKSLNVSPGAISIKPLDYFPSYGLKKAASMIEFSYSGKLPAKITTLISMEQISEPKVETKSVFVNRIERPLKNNVFEYTELSGGLFKKV